MNSANHGATPVDGFVCKRALFLTEGGYGPKMAKSDNSITEALPRGMRGRHGPCIGGISPTVSVSTCRVGAGASWAKLTAAPPQFMAMRAPKWPQEGGTRVHHTVPVTTSSRGHSRPKPELTLWGIGELCEPWGRTSRWFCEQTGPFSDRG